MKNTCKIDNRNKVKVKVWGDYACFTRPQMKAQRLSYDIITPSAARGIIQSIFYKPQIKWIIEKITVVNKIQFCNMRKNQIGKKIPTPKKSQVQLDDSQSMIGIFIQNERQQRSTTLLSNVQYIIQARFQLVKQKITDKYDMNQYELINKYSQMFNRRVRSGQCANQPYFGLRQFVAYFLPCDQNVISYYKDFQQIDLGYMLLDFDYSSEKDYKFNPIFFPAIMKNGVVQIPEIYPVKQSHKQEESK